MNSIDRSPGSGSNGSDTGSEAGDCHEGAGIAVDRLPVPQPSGM